MASRVAEPPTLWLGVAGFSETDQQSIARIAHAYQGQVVWRLCAFQDADAWLVNGARLGWTGADVIRVAPGRPTERAVRLSLRDVNRPVSFAAPVPVDFGPLSMFDLQEPRTLEQVLDLFTVWLRPRRVQFQLGREIVLRGASLRHGVFHLIRDGQLCAVLDFRSGRAGLAPDLSATDLPEATWAARPEGAGYVPSGFVNTTIAQLSWTYVRHSTQHLLPARYWSREIFFRAPPKVPISWISDTQLVLLRELHERPGTLQALVQRTGLVLEQICRDLSCLYFAGAITSTPSKSSRLPAAAAIGERQESRPPSLDSLSLSPATEILGDVPTLAVVPDGLTRQYRTVPAPLIAA